MSLRISAGVRKGRLAGGEAGFSLIQIMVTVAIIAVVTSFAVVRITVARDHMRLTSAARDFASFTEKARLDSIRRHGENLSAARISIETATTYRLFADHNYDGTPSWRDFTLPQGVSVDNVDVTDPANNVLEDQPLPITIAFDWHGRSANGYRITFKNTRAHESLVGVTRAGEVSIDRKPITLLAGGYDPVGGDSRLIGPVGGPPPPPPLPGGTPYPLPSATPTPIPLPTPIIGGSGGGNGGGNGGGGSGGGGTNTGGGTGGGGGTSTGGGGTTTGDGSGSGGTTAQCTMTISPTTTLKQPLRLRNGNSLGSASISITLMNAPLGAGFSAVEVGGATHLVIVPSTNSVTITAMPGTTNRGNFTVRVTPSTGCGSSQDIYVSVAR